MICKIEGCLKESKIKNQCLYHYKKYHKSDINCSIEGCNNKSIARKLCSIHYSRYKIYKDPNIIFVEKHNMSDSPEYGALKNIKKKML